MTILQLPAVGRQHGRGLDRWFTWIGGAVVLGVRRIAAAGLTQHYRVPETAIRIATNRPIAALAPVSALLAATDAAD